MRKLKLLLTTAVIAITVMLCCSINAFALTDGDWEFQLLDNEATITGYIGEGDNEVVIPDTLYGAKVTKFDIKDNKVINNTKTVIFPATVQSVSKIVGATVESVIIPEGVEEIAPGAFKDCKSLKSVSLPSTLKRILQGSFGGCESLKELKFPSGLEEIKSYPYHVSPGSTFDGSGIETVDLSHTNASLGEYLFYKCKNLKTVKLPENIKEIPSHLFYESSLEHIDIPSTVESIQGWAFAKSPIKDIILPTSLKSIGNKAFYLCNNLDELIVPYGTEKIEVSAFERAEKLQSLFVPDTVTQCDGAFDYISDNCIVYCISDSKVAEECKKESISYLTDNSVNSGIHVYYNGKRISFHSYGQNPELLEGRTLVPLRSLFEAMGAEVDWDDATSTAIAKRDGVTVTIQIGASEIYKNGKAVSLDVPAQLMNGRTMVPARAIVEAFGADVEWNGNGRVVFITENR